MAITEITGEAVPACSGQRYELAAVMCGSYRRNPSGLRSTFESLSRHFNLLSPSSVEFTSFDVDFVRLLNEADEPAPAVEARHLAAIRRADFVWLHCPEGYVGTSAALELGYAKAAGVPIVTDTRPTDEILADTVVVVPDFHSVAQIITPKPGEGLAALQDYYERIARRRGWAEESPRDTLLLLTEELGELARAVRKSSRMARDGEYSEEPVGHELADVQLYLVHLANALGVDLASAVTEKEVVNSDRHRRRTETAA